MAGRVNLLGMGNERSGRSGKRRVNMKYVFLALLAVATLAVVGFSLLKPSPDYGTYTAPKITTSAKPTVKAKPLTGLLAGTGPLTIGVLGDSTGNGEGEWVDLWAQDLAKSGTVTLHQWDSTKNAWFPNTTTYPGGARQITIWNGSQPGSNYTYPLENLAVISPEKPKFMILNFGHNGAPQRVDAGMVELLAAVEKKWGPTPAVITLQNPSQGEREQRTAFNVAVLREWATEAGYPVIDVNKAFMDTGKIAPLLTDDVHPNAAGSRIWADTVIKAIR